MGSVVDCMKYIESTTANTDKYTVNISHAENQVFSTQFKFNLYFIFGDFLFFMQFNNSD